jgi:hypothetical protein
MPDKDMEEIAHYRVKVIVEELDGNGEVIDVVSEHILADYENDQDDDSVGQKSDNYFNKVVRTCVHGKLV